MKKKSNVEKLANFLLELRVFKYAPRASISYLKGPIKENVAEHCFFTTMIGWVLARLEKANENKVIKMCLIHDLAETRGGERSLINKFYSQPLNEPKMIQEICQDCSLEDFQFTKLFREFFEEKTKEAKVAKDADILSQMMWEKECLDLGNQKAKKWVDFSLSRLKTKSGKKLGRKLKTVDSDEWWMEIFKKYILKTKFL
ncbi:HD domain-containing protein [Patescibacteria group bacterium]|nr:HD domain-containing protein [Patescibacteria group bacterium]